MGKCFNLKRFNISNIKLRDFFTCEWLFGITNTLSCFVPFPVVPFLPYSIFPLYFLSFKSIYFFLCGFKNNFISLTFLFSILYVLPLSNLWSFFLCYLVDFHVHNQIYSDLFTLFSCTFPFFGRHFVLLSIVNFTFIYQMLPILVLISSAFIPI